MTGLEHTVVVWSNGQNPGTLRGCRTHQLRIVTSASCLRGSGRGPGASETVGLQGHPERPGERISAGRGALGALPHLS